METGRPGITEIEATATGINGHHIRLSEVNVYPNPCTEGFTITNIDSRYAGGELNLFSMQGKLLGSWSIAQGIENSELSVNLSKITQTIAPGCYNLVMSKNNNSRAINLLIR